MQRETLGDRQGMPATTSLAPSGYNGSGWGRFHPASSVGGLRSLHCCRLTEDLVVSRRNQSFVATVGDNRKSRLAIWTAIGNGGLTTACRDAPGMDLATAFRLQPSMSASLDIEGYGSQHGGTSHAVSIAHPTRSQQIYLICLAFLAIRWYDA